MPLRLRALLEAAGAPFTVIDYPREAVLFRQGDACTDAWCIEEGSVRLAVTSAEGKEAISGLLGPGSLVSDDLLAGRREFRHSAVAVAPAVVLRVPGDRMIELLHTQPAILDHVLEHVMARHIQLEDALVYQILYPGEERLAHTLLLLAACDKRAGRCALPHMSQEILAEMVGTTRSRVNAFMSRFKKLGFIETSDGETYVHSARLSRVVHHPQ